MPLSMLHRCINNPTCLCSSDLASPGPTNECTSNRFRHSSFMRLFQPRNPRLVVRVWVPIILFIFNLRSNLLSFRIAGPAPFPLPFPRQKGSGGGGETTTTTKHVISPRLNWGERGGGCVCLGTSSGREERGGGDLTVTLTLA